MRYELTKDLETGNVFIDGEHKQLFKAVNDLLDACGKGQGREALQKTITFLSNYVDTHFSHEEQLQQKNGYPGMTAHKAFHEKYKQTLKEITSGISADKPSVGELSKLNVHIGLLITHIRTEDKKLGAFLNKA